MGTHVPEKVRSSRVILDFKQAGLEHIHQGKVRDTFSLPDYPDLLLQYVTDRVSIFDFVLPSCIEDKGKILVAISVFWFHYLVEKKGLKHHLVACGNQIDKFLPPALKGNPSLYARVLIVKKLNIVPIECIARGYLTGSGLRDYRKTGKVCGYELPPSLDDGDKLPQALFTPSTKAETGHDKNIDAIEVDEQYGIWMRLQTLDIFEEVSDFARQRGIIIADTKFEFGTDCSLADEVLTPDSSRFWDMTDWINSRGSGHAPSPMDKELVRNAGRDIPTPFAGCKHLGQLDPDNPDHCAWVDTLDLDRSTCMKTTYLYHKIFMRLTGMTLSSYQLLKMGLPSAAHT